MSSRNIYPLVCHSLNEESLTAEQGRHGMRKSNASRQGLQRKGVHSNFPGQLFLGQEDSGIRSAAMTRVFFQVC